MEKASPEQLAQIREEKEEKTKESIEWLEGMAKRLNLEIEPLPIIDDEIERRKADFGLSEEELKKSEWTSYQRGRNHNGFVLKGKVVSGEMAGQEVKAVVYINPQNGTEFAADILSPLEYQGHGGNHDFTRTELEGSLKFALGK